MADALLKMSDTSKRSDSCKASDNDGLLVNILLEALTSTNRLNVGAYGRSTRSPTNYSSAGQSIDQHLAGIDTALGGAAVLPTGNAGDLMQCVSGTSYDARGASSGDRITGTVYGTSFNLSTELAVGTYLKVQSNRLRLGNLGGGSPLAQAVGDLYYNSTGLHINDGSIRTILHSNTSFVGDVTGTSGATVVGNDSHTHGNSTLTGVPGAGTDTNVTNLRGYSVQTGAPATNDRLQYISSQWQHVRGLAPDYTYTRTVNVNSSYAHTHGLGSVPRLIICQVSANSNMNPCQLAGWGWMHGENTGANNRGTIICDITTTTYSIRTGAFASPYGVFESFGFGGTRINYGNGTYVRVMMWI